jgi:outer membrane receptor for ferrienterochelin and colicins
LDTSPGVSGSDRARRSFDMYVGSVYPKLGYWRLGIYNIGNAKYIKDRYYASASGTTAYQDSSVLSFTPRVYVTVGTQF